MKESLLKKRNSITLLQPDERDKHIVTAYEEHNESTNYTYSYLTGNIYIGNGINNSYMPSLLHILKIVDIDELMSAMISEACLWDIVFQLEDYKTSAKLANVFKGTLNDPKKGDGNIANPNYMIHRILKNDPI